MRSHPRCLPYLAKLRGLENGLHPSMLLFMISLIDHFFFASVILGFLVILGKQLFSGLVGSSGNRRVAFASLSDFDIEVGYWQFV